MLEKTLKCIDLNNQYYVLLLPLFLCEVITRSPIAVWLRWDFNLSNSMAATTVQHILSTHCWVMALCIKEHLLFLKMDYLNIPNLQKKVTYIWPRGVTGGGVSVTRFCGTRPLRRTLCNCQHKLHRSMSTLAFHDLLIAYCLLANCLVFTLSVITDTVTLSFISGHLKNPTALFYIFTDFWRLFRC